MATRPEIFNDHKLCKPHIPYIYSNWCWFDSLDGKELKDGEMVEITWPDGERTVQQVSVKNSTRSYMDMGHVEEIPVTKAYVICMVHGSRAFTRIIEADLRSAQRVDDRGEPA